MTYLQFHLAFMLPPLLVLVPMALKARHTLDLRRSAAFLLVSPIALIYTTPWDNYLVASGVWTYPPDRIISTIGYVPVEEYAFFILQPMLTGALFTLLVDRWLTRQSDSEALVGAPAGAGRWSMMARLVIAGFVACTLAGAWLLTFDQGRYMGLILVWAGPVLLAMWLYRGPEISRLARPATFAVAATTGYLWLADWTAIRTGIWSISDRFTLGWAPFGLPVEEALFFLATNLLVVFGTALFICPARDPSASAAP